MFQLASASVWLVTGRPWTVKLVKCTPLMLTVEDRPCRLTTFFTSEETLVK
ncbi:hypothetical protein [Micromonospora wenchangensis]|uniref:hypothetical protein n=1 Tax=Micromonospora wenchangensis TaxID=1185415 RepID=UPI00267A6F43